MSSYEDKFDELRIAFTEHRAKSEAGHRAIMEDVDELKADLKGFKKEVGEQLDKLNNSMNELKVQMAGTRKVQFPKDIKTWIFIIFILGSLGILGPGGIALADKMAGHIDLPVIENMEGSE